MTSETNDLAEYEAAVCRLIRRAKQMRSSDWNPTVLRREIIEIADQVQALADLLDRCGSAQSDIEEHHDAELTRGCGFDGVPIDPNHPWRSESAPQGIWWPSYGSIKSSLSLLAESARDAAKEVPDPRENRALKFAVLGFLHLRSFYGFARPALSDSSADVEAFGKIWARVCECDRVPLSPGRLRGAMSSALQEFDPHFWPPGIEELFGQ